METLLEAINTKPRVLMKTHHRNTILLAIVVYALGIGASVAQDEKLEALYQQWHAALDGNPILVEPHFFDVRIPELRPALEGMMSNRIAMAYFICERVATNQYTDAEMRGPGRLYRDLNLLRYLTGIHVFEAYAKPGEENFIGNVDKFRARFKEDWVSGVFRDPSTKIEELCAAAMPRERDGRIDKDTLIAIRHYGIFGLPELTRQMRKHNSRHAFAAYLVVTGQWDVYEEYISKSNQQFTNAEAKLEHVKQWLDELKRMTKGAETNELVQKISTVLAE